MAPMLQQPELWAGLGFLALVIVVLRGNAGERRKRAARMARVTHDHQPRRVSGLEQTLRKRDPNANSRFGQALANFSISDKLQARLLAAGMEVPLQRLALRAMGIGFVVFLLVVLLGKPFLLAVLLGLLAGIGLPHVYIGRRIKKRKLQFLKLFPEGIDLIVRGLRAGLPVAESFIVVSKEIAAPVGEVFFTISQQTGLGVPMEKALSDTARKLDMTEFNFFVTTIILQRETGGNLGEILSNLSDVLRQRQMMKLKIGALSSEARASGIIVGALPFFVFAILSLISPDYLTPLFVDFRGNLALAGAGGMMLFGGFVMKRMTQLEI